MWLKIAVIWTVVTVVVTINRPVYKVVLTQKGFAQFLQYDVETPPLIEFTFCTWIRLYNLNKEQTIFTYIVNSNRNMVRFWLDAGGRNVQLTINGWLATTSPIEMVQDVWKHVCVSYQSDFGAWALYVDSRLVTCGASQALNGFVLPPGGSVIIGYGTTDSGSPSGLDGEIFGANMILTSTIERNYTMKQNPRYKQKLFHKNKVKEHRGESYKYVVLSELKGNKIRNTFENYPFIVLPNTTSKANSQYFFNESTESSNERDILDFAIPGRMKTTTNDPNSIQFWNLIDTTREGMWPKKKTNGEPFSSGTNELPSVSEFETPPPPVTNIHFDYFNSKPENNKIQIYDSKLSEKLDDIKKTVRKQTEPSEVETPPPPQNDNNVYGQWVSSKFAGSVLNHLRSIRFNKKDLIKPPPTLPLYKTSDAFPYASEFRLTKLKPPSQFQRRNFIDTPFHSEIYEKRRKQYNVQILEDDIRDRILRTHSKVKPMNIDVINLGESTQHPARAHRFYRQVADSSQASSSSESIEFDNTPRPFRTTTIPSTTTKVKSQEIQGTLSTQEIANLLKVLPFLKTLENFADTDKTESQNVLKKDIYTRSLIANKWHNTKSYSNDYTPRQVHVHANEPFHGFDSKLADNKHAHPAVKLKYKHESRKGNMETPFYTDRAKAKNVSSQADIGKDSVSIQQFVYENLPNKAKNKEKDNTNGKSKFAGQLNKHPFNKAVKIGNALNERNVIGDDDVQKKRSFVGGDARVPDINRYRSDIDKEKGNVPASLSPKICKNVELYDRVLYIQPDESVDLTHLMSPLKLKNVAIEFIQQNYRLCSLAGSLFEKDPLLYLDWSKTPVRLFGGAYLKPTTDLCGFF